jgi:plasmid maintenance system antidote protein VapI
MNIREYLDENGISVTDFADILEYSRTHVNLVIMGHSKPGIKMIKKIINITGGKVSAEELMNIKRLTRKVTYS